MRAVNHTLALRHLVHAVHKNRALVLQFLHHEPVVDNLLAHINRRPKCLQRDPDNVNGPDHPGAEPTRFQQQQILALRQSIPHSSRLHVFLEKASIQGIENDI
jgi:hypothetical protein